MIIDSVGFAVSDTPGPKKSIQRVAGASVRVLQRAQRAEEPRAGADA
jgi:hypothetical protein